MSPYNALWPMVIALAIAVVSLGLIVKVVGDLQSLRKQFSLNNLQRELYHLQRKAEAELELLAERSHQQSQQSLEQLKATASALQQRLEEQQTESGLYQRVLELEKIIERNSAALDKAVHSHSMTNQLQSQFKEFVKTEEERRTKAEETISALDNRTESVTTRLQQMESLLQQTRSEIAEVGNALKASGEQTRTSGKSLEKTVKSSAEKVAVIQRQLEESARMFERMADYSQSLEAVVSRVSELESRLIDMSGSLEHALEMVSSIQPEPSANGNRITEQNGASLTPVESAEISIGNGRQKRPPRIISPEGRAQYQKVLDMWTAGSSPSEIASSINLDEAEVELILAGESSSASA